MDYNTTIDLPSLRQLPDLFTILLANQQPIKIIVGARDTQQVGWISTDIHSLNLLDRRDWQKNFAPGTISAIMGEHVWEHLTQEEGIRAAEICYELGLTQKLIQPSPLAPLPQEREGKIRILRPFSCGRSDVLSLSKEGWGMRRNFTLRKSYEYLQVGGYLRLAVPDGLHPNPAYLNWVRPQGVEPDAEDHKLIYDYRSLGKLLRTSGFRVQILEYFDELGRFHYQEWNPEQGLIQISQRFDPRNRSYNQICRRPHNQLPIPYNSIVDQ